MIFSKGDEFFMSEVPNETPHSQSTETKPEEKIIYFIDSSGVVHVKKEAAIEAEEAVRPGHVHKSGE